MEPVTMLFVLAMLAVRGAALFAIVYFGARLAIRHERGGL
jgi:hypothetical protein